MPRQPATVTVKIEERDAGNNGAHPAAPVGKPIEADGSQIVERDDQRSNVGAHDSELEVSFTPRVPSASVHMKNENGDDPHTPSMIALAKMEPNADNANAMTAPVIFFMFLFFYHPTPMMPM